MKAGMMPLHIWLPGAHAMAPSHVSALMSGVLIKIGIYGLVRVTSLLPDPPDWWGATTLAFGVISGVFGVAFAIGQHDLRQPPHERPERAFSRSNAGLAGTHWGVSGLEL